MFIYFKYAYWKFIKRNDDIAKSLLSAYYLLNKLAKATDKVGYRLVSNEIKDVCKKSYDVGYKSIFYYPDESFDLKYKDKFLFSYSLFGIGADIQIALSFKDEAKLIQTRMSLEYFLNQNKITYDEFIDIFEIKEIEFVLDEFLNKNLNEMFKLIKRK